MPKSVFFSYAREDRDHVTRLAQSLRSAGYTPLYDADIVGGQQWWDRLLAKIEGCDVFVPVLSSAYLRSVPCRLEVSYAVELGKPIVPLDMGAGGIAGAAFIEPIKAAQWVPYDDSELTTTVLSLIGAVNAAPSAPPVPQDTKRPPAPGLDVLSTTVRLVGSSDNLTETEQWAVVGELRANMRGEHQVAARTLLATFLERRDLLASVHADAEAMTRERGFPSQAPPVTVTPPPGLDGPERPKASPSSRTPVAPPTGDQAPHGYALWSIIVLVLGFLTVFFSEGFPPSYLPPLLAAVALFYSWRTRKLWSAGEENEARWASRDARRWSSIAAGVLAVVWVLGYLVAMFG